MPQYQMRIRVRADAGVRYDLTVLTVDANTILANIQEVGPTSPLTVDSDIIQPGAPDLPPLRVACRAQLSAREPPRTMALEAQSSVDGSPWLAWTQLDSKLVTANTTLDGTFDVENNCKYGG
jgi:hypothetical protein